MKTAGVRLQLATRGTRRYVTAQLVAQYEQRVLLLIDDTCVEMRATQLHAFSLFAHTLRVVFRLPLRRIAPARWRTSVVPALLAAERRGLRSAA